MIAVSIVEVAWVYPQRRLPVPAEPTQAWLPPRLEAGLLAADASGHRRTVSVLLPARWRRGMAWRPYALNFGAQLAAPSGPATRRGVRRHAVCGVLRDWRLV